MLEYDKLLSDTVLRMEKSGIRKYFDLLETMGDVVGLTVGQPDFVTPWHIREAGIESLEKGKTYYTSNAGTMDLRVEIDKYLTRRFDISYDPKSEIIVTVGGSEAIDIAIRAIVSAGDEVIIPTPSFVCYAPITKMAGGVPVTIETRNEDKFKLTAAQLKSAITPRTKLLVLPYPNNPTGAIMTRDELEEIAAVLRDTNILVLSDEIYAEMTYGKDHCSIASIDGMRERTVIVSGFSKAYAMTGWRIGYLAAAEWIVKGCNKLQGQYTSGPCSVSQMASLEAYTGSQEPVEEMRKAFQRRRDLIVKLAKEIPGLEVNVPEGAFYLFPKCSSFYGKSYNGTIINNSDDLAMYLLTEAHVAAVGGTSFGAPECFRMSYATSDENIIEAIRRIKEALAKLS